MIRLTTLATIAFACTIGSSALARPIVNQLNLTTTAGTSSQERTVGLDTRSADDFVIPGPTGQVGDINTIQVIMLGQSNGIIPPLTRFGVTIYSNSTLGGDHPGTAMYTKLGASLIQDLGIVSGTTHRYKVTFVCPPGTCRVWKGQRYWISGFGRLNDSNSYSFGQYTNPLATRPTWIKSGTGAWFAVPSSWGDRAFLISAY